MVEIVGTKIGSTVGMRDCDDVNSVGVIVAAVVGSVVGLPDGSSVGIAVEMIVGLVVGNKGDCDATKDIGLNEGISLGSELKLSDGI